MKEEALQLGQIKQMKELVRIKEKNGDNSEVIVA